MGTIRDPYQQTREAIEAYDAEPTSGNADLVRVAFWLEASMGTRAKHPNPSIDKIRAIAQRLVTR